MNDPVEVPLSALTPAPWNPRTITDERFESLCRSIEADPELLWRRPILATADGVIYAGNMRYRAALALELKVVPAVLEDIPEVTAKVRALRDNEQWGEWRLDALTALFHELVEGGVEIDIFDWPEVAPDPEDPDLTNQAQDGADKATAAAVGKPVYTIVFDDEAQKGVWQEFLGWLKERYPDQPTPAGRVVEHLGTVLDAAGS